MFYNQAKKEAIERLKQEEATYNGYAKKEMILPLICMKQENRLLRQFEELKSILIHWQILRKSFKKMLLKQY